MWSLIYAEQKGITSQNIDTFLRGATETDESYISRVGPSIAQFLDTQLGMGSSLGLDNDFVVDIIRQVGTYGEIYQRHLGPSQPLTIERSFNALWTGGGLLHTPDWR
jgi:general L-amino acid transport system substrate-binding protein